MWQRVQTLYLAIATILIGALFFCNFATIVGPDGEDVHIRFSEKLPYLLFLIMLIVAQALAIGSFKYRLLQMRICMLAAILLVAFQIWLAVDVIRYLKDMVFSFTTVFPIVAAILDVLAARNILIDESLVRNSTHLRRARRK